jgi:2-amino-4-hydroxy-6-hydroxymethyldihydropteridine diphosphokinase
MTTAYLGLGANLGDRLAQIENAVVVLATFGEAHRVSPLYASDAVGGPPGQRRYLNCVMELDTWLAPHDLLRAGLDLEGQAGRVRTVRNGPRPLDVDLLLYGAERIDEGDLLQVPHPRIHERPFVLLPLADLAPDLVPEQVMAGDARSEGLRRVCTLEL